LNLFVDTSGLLAVLDAGDSQHVEADAAWQQILSSDDKLISTNYVLLETCALVQRRLGMEAVRAIEHDFFPLLEIEWLDAEVHETAMQALLMASRRRLSLVDCTSFEVMRRREIRRAFTLDPHFAEHGFESLPAM
jgi:predicted nucleic acid-binding protein